MKIVKKDKFQCTMCDKYFGIRIGITQHIKNTHKIPTHKIENMIKDTEDDNGDTGKDLTKTIVMTNPKKRKASMMITNIFDPRVKIRKLDLYDLLTKHTLKLT